MNNKYLWYIAGGLVLYYFWKQSQSAATVSGSITTSTGPNSGLTTLNLGSGPVVILPDNPGAGLSF
jgi:hypothetical protein